MGAFKLLSLVADYLNNVRCNFFSPLRSPRVYSPVSFLSFRLEASLRVDALVFGIVIIAVKKRPLPIPTSKCRSFRGTRHSAGKAQGWHCRFGNTGTWDSSFKRLSSSSLPALLLLLVHTSAFKEKVARIISTTEKYRRCEEKFHLNRRKTT